MWSSLEVTGRSRGEESIEQLLSNILKQHPNLRHQPYQAETIIKETLVTPIETVPVQNLPFSSTGEGWLEERLGMGAEKIVRALKKHRRHQKDIKGDIDNMVNLIRTLKSQEVQSTLDSIDWAIGRQDTLRNLGLSDQRLKSLRKFHNSRSDSLLHACERWEAAESALKMLDEYDDVWADEERKAWVNAMEAKREARKMWGNALRQSDLLSKEQQNWLKMAKTELGQWGAMTAREILANHPERKLTPSKLAKLLKMYGEEYDIVKGVRKSQYVLMKSDGLFLKNSDVWNYAGGFLDADGSIYITDRGEPRASFIATGTRGRVHCEELHKTLGGVLQLDQKVYKNGQRSQHRISFYAKDDLRKLLDGLLPHLRMKDTQAKAVLAYIDEPDMTRKSQLQKLVQFLNWDGTIKGEKALRDWGVDRDIVMSWREGL
jgi:hypothetical protein